MSKHGRLIDANALESIKFHPLPYTHIVPDDVNAESYQRGWNDAVDAIIENAPTIEPERKTGAWKRITEGRIPELYICPFCHRTIEDYGIEVMVAMRYPFCHCGADMRGEQHE